MESNVVVGKFALSGEHAYRQLAIHLNNFDVEHGEMAFLRDFTSPVHGVFMTNLVEFYGKETITGFLQDMVLGREGVA